MFSLLTIGLFLIGKYLHQRWQYLLFVPVFFTVVGCIIVLLLGRIPFGTYFESNRPLTFMLQPAVVALGVLLYKQWIAIRNNLRPLLISVVLSSFLSVFLIIVLAKILSFPTELAASMVPLGITTPIAIAVTEPLGGNPAITSVIIIGVGLLGNMMGPFLLNRVFKIHWYPAIGLAIGQTSHGIGTARAVQINEVTGTFSGLAMSLNGVITVFTAPLVWALFY